MLKTQKEKSHCNKNGAVRDILWRVSLPRFLVSSVALLKDDKKMYMYKYLPDFVISILLVE